jgi:hypothetical protein
MPYSFLHVAAMRNDSDSAIKYLEGGGEDSVHVWPGKQGRTWHGTQCERFVPLIFPSTQSILPPFNSDHVCTVRKIAGADEKKAVVEPIHVDQRDMQVRSNRMAFPANML